MSSAQRIAVWEGRKEKTSGGLRKGDLIKNRQGRIVSKKKSAVAKRLNNLGSHLRGKKKAESKKAEPKKVTKKAAKKKASKPVEDEEYVDDEVREKKRKKPKKGFASTNVDVANIVSGRRRRRKPRGGAVDLKTVLEQAAEVKPKPKRKRRLKSKKLIVQL